MCKGDIPELAKNEKHNVSQILRIYFSATSSWCIVLSLQNLGLLGVSTCIYMYEGYPINLHYPMFQGLGKAQYLDIKMIKSMYIYIYYVCREIYIFYMLCG